MYKCFHCLYHSLKVFFEEKQYFFADLPANSAFPNLTLDARSSVIYNLYGGDVDTAALDAVAWWIWRGHCAHGTCCDGRGASSSKITDTNLAE